MAINYRNAKVNCEKRAVSACEEQGVKVRAKRKNKGLPLAGDDASRADTINNWKRHRLTQYR